MQCYRYARRTTEKMEPFVRRFNLKVQGGLVQWKVVLMGTGEKFWELGERCSRGEGA